MPVEAILLLPLLDRSAQKLLQHLEVNLALGERLGKQRLQLLNILRHHIRRSGLNIFSGESLHLFASFSISLPVGGTLYIADGTHLLLK